MMFAKCSRAPSGARPRSGQPRGLAGRKGRVGIDQATSNRSRSITLYQAATKSATNFSFASSLA
jgi:hypothetical protein